MKSKIKHLAWICANWYAKIFCRSFLAPIHHGIIVLCLHALGYDNAWGALDFTGENWFIRKYVKKIKPTVCIDVGANIGEYNEMLLRETTAEVYAFEPSPDSFAILKRKGLSNSRFHPQEYAISNFFGTTTFFQQGGSYFWEKFFRKERA